MTKKRLILNIPHRPEALRQYYAKFFAEQEEFLNRYKKAYTRGMNERFATDADRKERPAAN